MRFVLAALITGHGLLHLIGPARAFGWANVAALWLPASKTAGVMWLVAAGLFLAAAVMLVVSSPPFPAREWWWIPAVAAVALSQVLVIASWADARFGTVPNLIILIPSLLTMLAALPGSYPSEFRREAAAATATVAQGSSPAIGEADLVGMPALVQRYLRAVGVVGRPPVRHFRVTFRGGLRSEPDSAWMPSVALQHTLFNPSKRVFIVHASMYGVPFDALHVFTSEAATMRVKIASMVQVVDARGPEMDRSETVTFFNDMWLLAPASLVGAPILWEPIDSNSVRARFTEAGHTVSATLSFGPNGLLMNFVSDDRSRSSDGITYERLRWSTPISGWSTIDGRLLPTLAEARWTLPSGEFTYARFELTAMAYNVSGGKD